MPHIHTEPGDHDHTVTAIIIRVDGNEPRVLLHKHKKYGMLMNAGGHVEIKENPWDAILHEIEEEDGYLPEQLRLLQPKHRMKSMTGNTLDESNSVVHPMPMVHATHIAAPSHFHTDTTYLFVTRELPAKAPAEGESADLKWYTLDEIKGDFRELLFDNVVEMLEFAFSLVGVWEEVPDVANYGKS